MSLTVNRFQTTSQKKKNIFAAKHGDYRIIIFSDSVAETLSWGSKWDSFPGGLEISHLHRLAHFVCSSNVSFKHIMQWTIYNK